MPVVSLAAWSMKFDLGVGSSLLQASAVSVSMKFGVGVGSAALRRVSVVSVCGLDR